MNLLEQRLVELEDELRALRRASDLESNELLTLLSASLKGDAASSGHFLRESQRLLTRRFQRRVPDLVPAGSRLVAITKGDEELLRLGHCTAEHFSQTLDGKPAHYWPACSLSAIAQLEAARARGAQYLVVPHSFAWWFDHYRGFHKHLATRYRLHHADDHTCRIYDVRDVVSSRAMSPNGALANLLSGWDAETQFSVLDWGARLDDAMLPESLVVFSPPEPDFAGDRLPYLDNSIDLVAIAAGASDRRAEAQRVARLGVLRVSESAPAALPCEWKIPLPAVNPAKATIIVPTYNGAGRVLACLRAVLETLPAEFAGEILVVDDASTDDSPRLLKEYARGAALVRVVSNRENLGFIRSCNRAAQTARGDILVFLNDDTIPLPGWLPPLVGLLRSTPDAGAVGAQLLYPDGRLQEAGAAIFRDGSGANIGRGDQNPEHPLYSFVRAVDYCSGAVLATPRDLFLDSGGFDERYCPAYYEDTDYCFRLRRSGRKTYYQPLSKVIHLEGASNGTQAHTGTKRYQELNRGKFLEAWQSEIARQSPAPPHFGMSTWHALTHGAGHRNGDAR